MVEIVPNEELRGLFRRLYATWQAKDVEGVRELFSSGAHCTIFGSDPEEWYVGQTGVEVLLRQVDESWGIVLKAREATGYSAGNVGWVAGLVDATFFNGVELTFRSSIVAAVERGQWRIVHFHQSLGQSNEEALGFPLTTSIDVLEQSVLVDRPDLRPASAPDGTVTIVFTDIEGSTALMERLGDMEFLRALAWHNQIVCAAAEEHRGFVVKSQGDGFMLAFPSAAYAIRACLAMRDRMRDGFEGHTIALRCGLHSGETIKRDDDFFGRTVVVAARIGSLATGGEILVSRLVYELTRGLGSFEFGPAVQTQLKGLNGEFELFPVIH